MEDTFSVEAFLSAPIIPDTEVGNPWVEPGYEGNIDYRIRQLSYSSFLTLHSCPRKFELYKLKSVERTEESPIQKVTLSFGHIVGQAIQDCLTGLDEEQIIFRMLLAWDIDLFWEDTKSNKSFWAAISAVQRMLHMRKCGFLEDWELVTYKDAPAVELSFCITLPDGFRFRGFVDAVLRNKKTGEIRVLELKTTGLANISPATYKNSAQGVGYSVVLDNIFPELSSYDVLYLIYQTKSKEYTPIIFKKSFLQRASWIRELLLDVEMIKLYESAEHYPMHGESCFNFFRECEYYQTCSLDTAHLTKPCSPEDEDKTEYQITLSLNDLITAQLEKGKEFSDDL